MKENRNKQEVLRYMGYKGQTIDAQLDAKIDELLQECQQKAHPKHITGRFSILQTEQGVLLKGTNITLLGEDIKKHLKNCESCIVLCATIGAEIDGFLRTKQVISMADAVIADSAATALIEAYCDKIEHSLRLQIQQEGKFLTWRYSCGYGDFPFTQQPQILALLDAQKYTGVTCTPSCIMTPAKSVTAIMGVACQKPQKNHNKCSRCPNRETCNFSCR